MISVFNFSFSTTSPPPAVQRFQFWFQTAYHDSPIEIFTRKASTVRFRSLHIQQASSLATPSNVTRLLTTENTMIFGVFSFIGARKKQIKNNRVPENINKNVHEDHLEIRARTQYANLRLSRSVCKIHRGYTTRSHLRAMTYYI